MSAPPWKQYAPTAPPAAVVPPLATSEPPIPLAEKAIGAGVLALPNMVGLTQIDPWLIGWSGAINVILDRVKNIKRFPESWTPVLMVAVAIVLGWLIYQVLAGQGAEVALGKGAWIATQTHANWVGGKRLGLFAATDPDKRFGA